MKYGFKCEDCTHRFEKDVIAMSSFQVRQKYRVTCPRCKSKNCKKLISASAVIFKGSGFYRNDSKIKKKV